MVGRGISPECEEATLTLIKYMHWFGLVWISALTNLYIQAFSRFTKKN